MNFFSPAEIAKNYIVTGKGKVNIPIPKMFLLAVLAGIFIAMGGVGATAAAAAMVKNWVVVYLGNLAGSILVAAGVVFSHQISLFDNGMAVSVISTASAKCALPFADALIKGILCNFLVCIAVWISFAAKDVAGKIAGLFFPIMIFVLSGFEHSVANMYYIAAGLFAQNVPSYGEAAAKAGLDTGVLTWGNFLRVNLLPVTLGNIIGGAVCVGCAYWFIYLRKTEK